MLFSSKKLVRLTLGFFLIFSGMACSSVSKSINVVYLIPEKFEGAVIVVYDQKDGETPQFDGKSYFLTIPDDGIVKVNSRETDLAGSPSFIFIDKNGNKTDIEYLLRQKVVSAEEKENKIFAMNYEKSNFNSANGRIFVRSFLICKVKDGNLFASRDLNQKIAEFQRKFPR